MLAMVVLGGIGHMPGVILGGVLLAALPEVLRYVVGPAQQAMFGRSSIDAEVLRQLLYRLAMVMIMLYRPAGLWPSPKHGRPRLPRAERTRRRRAAMAPWHDMSEQILSRRRRQQALRRPAGAVRRRHQDRAAARSTA